MQNITIRVAVPDDSQAIANLHHLVRETSMLYLPVLHTVDESIAFFAKVIENSRVLVAERFDSVIAYCAYGDGWVEHLKVHPDYQRRGVGAFLLEKAMAENESLRLWVFQKNQGAIRFYERFNFKLIRKTDGSENEEREPDALYEWSRNSA